LILEKAVALRSGGMVTQHSIASASNQQASCPSSQPSEALPVEILKEFQSQTG